MSLVLIGLMCIAVLTLAWTKSILLISIYPPQSHVLHVISEQKLYKRFISNDKSGVLMVDQINLSLADASTENKKTRIPFGDEDIIRVNAMAKSAGAEISVSRKSAQHGKHVFPAPKSILSSARYTVETSVQQNYSQNPAATTTNSDCNLAKGKWVIDQHRPLYSGFGCKQWLSSMWACRLTQRKDFKYEKLRWQPKDCEMEEFTGSKFLRRMENKTLAFVGDSISRQQFQSLMCMITGGKETHDVLDVGKEYDMVQAHGATRPDGWAYRFPRTNTTILCYWSATLCDLEPLDHNNTSTDVAMHLDVPPSFLRKFLPNFNVLVLNTDHHWNRGKLKANRWIMYVDGAPVKNTKLISMAGAKNFTIHSTIGWVNAQLAKHPGLKAFYRTVSPRHFFNGDWDTGGTCDNTSVSGEKEVVQDESSDSLAEEATKGTGVKLLDITALSQLRDEGHISRYSIHATRGVQDCLHWCLPGVPDTWNEILSAQL